ncbi:MAG: PAS domain-containing protein [Spirochaetales bacterium]|nr:PAS domain-containing protein [Spirochaetales bacterium]
MEFLSPIYTEKRQCQDCYKCIRECPVKAIRVENGHAMVVSGLCVLCGHCVTICPAGAKRVRDDRSRARQLLSLKERVFVSLAPSFVSEFPEVSPANLVSAIKKLGFFGVSETAIGADLVSSQLAEDFSSLKNRISASREKVGPHERLLLSSACPVAVEYIKQYLPDLSPCVTDRASPLLAHARFLKDLYGPDIGVVFIGPCIAKKREADVWQTIDCAISFQDLRQWFAEEGVGLENTERKTSEGFVPFSAAKGSLYPIDGGMVSSIEKYPQAKGFRTMAVAGLDEIDRALRDLHPEGLDDPLFIELLACPGGCLNGPLASREGSSAIRKLKLLEYGGKAKDTATHRKQIDMQGVLPVERIIRPVHSDDEIRQALKQVGKLSLQDELNCGSCGYDTCRQFVAAMLEHRAERTMCVSYMRKLAQKKANGLIRVIPSGVVICDADLKIIECNENFARLMGSETELMFEAKPGMEGADLALITGMSRFFTDVMTPTGPDVVEHEWREGKKIFQATVFSIEKGESACGVIQDVTAPQVRRDRVIRQTRRVIDKNLAVVQKIAFLLGENAAETEATLNSIIESFSVDESDEEKIR